jgi:hypothetical protein
MSLIYWPAKLVAKFSPWAGNRLLLTGHAIPFLAHHGLQRSVTNYLNQCLLRLKVYSLNVFDEKRSSPRHKHCRWYSDKGSTPPFLVEQYGNSHTANSLFQLNRACLYPSYTKHLVVCKQKKDWLVSILNWGWRCGWFSDESHATASLHELSTDYDCYLSFWRYLSLGHPDSVSLILLDDILCNPAALYSVLHSIGVEVKVEGFGAEIDAVPQSPANRSSRFDQSDMPASLFDG